MNVVGGCCGTTPEHTRAIADAVAGSAAARRRRSGRAAPRFSGLEPFEIGPDTGFVMIGERTNVTGSARFRRLIEAGDYQGAVEVALEQVRGGANLLDVNMDADLLDGEQAMTTFLNLIATEPEVARLPIMVDSSRWSVLEAGLKCVQGKGIVNSISLKEGEEQFLEQARRIRDYGAGVVVMAFDEEGQATRRRAQGRDLRPRLRPAHRRGRLPARGPRSSTRTCSRSRPGSRSTTAYAKAFIEALPLIKERCPGARTSGGISNLSFSFRGNDAVREAMHAAFLYHAIRAGLDMGIVNAGQLVVYEDIEPELLERVEDVLFDRRPDATERLVEFAEPRPGRGDEARARPLLARGAGREAARARARARHRRLHRGGHRGGARRRATRPLDVIEGPLMDGMQDRRRPLRLREDVPAAGREERAGDEARGRLPRAVHGGGEATGGSRAQGKVVLATVKGDVHDIGKNIVGVVLGCNNYEVIDLGVMVPAETILDTAVAEGADVVGLSGLITPSLDQMVDVASEMERRGLELPLLIGGATTSRQHTAVRIAPAYSQRDGARARRVARRRRRLRPARPGAARDARRREPRAAGAAARAARREASAGRCCRSTAARAQPRAASPSTTCPCRRSPARASSSRRSPSSCPYIDWQFFFHAWELKGKFPAILEQPAARELYDDALALLDEIVARRARSRRAASTASGRRTPRATTSCSRTATRFPFLRQQAA